MVYYLCAMLVKDICKRKLSSGAQCTPGQWQLVSAVCIQRPPIITPKLTSLQRKYSDLLMKMEVESSILSNHELYAIEDR